MKTWPLKVMPIFYGSGDRIYLIPEKWKNRVDERYLGLSLISQRRLFGMVFSSLVGDYYYRMPDVSGVLIAPFVPTRLIDPAYSFPGDIDLLVLPYEGSSLILSQAMAIELKIVRASFFRQGKAPNEYGFSQAGALIDMGFPRVSVGHLIVSDRSPTSHWEEVAVTTIINSQTGEVDDLLGFSTDLMPSRLIDRCFGRMKSNCQDEIVGLASIYMEDDCGWIPSGRASKLNPKVNIGLLDRLADFYYEYYGAFLLTPKHPLQ